MRYVHYSPQSEHAALCQANMWPIWPSRVGADVFDATHLSRLGFDFNIPVAVYAPMPEILLAIGLDSSVNELIAELERAKFRGVWCVNTGDTTAAKKLRRLLAAARGVPQPPTITTGQLVTEFRFENAVTPLLERWLSKFGQIIMQDKHGLIVEMGKDTGVTAIEAVTAVPVIAGKKLKVTDIELP